MTAQNKTQHDKPSLIKFLFGLIVFNALAVWGIMTFAYFLIPDYESFWIVYIGSLGIVILMGSLTGDFPSLFTGYYIPRKRKSARFKVAFLGIILSCIIAFFITPNNQTCIGTILDYEYIQTKDHMFPLVTVNCPVTGDTITKLAAIHNKERIEPILENAVNYKQEVMIIYNQMRGLRGLKISETILKDPIKSARSDQSFPLAIFQASLIMVFLGVSNIRIRRFGYADLNPMSQREKDGYNLNE